MVLAPTHTLAYAWPGSVAELYPQPQQWAFQEPPRLQVWSFDFRTIQASKHHKGAERDNWTGFRLETYYTWTHIYILRHNLQLFNMPLMMHLCPWERILGTGETVHQWRELTAVTEEPSPISNTHNGQLETSVPEDPFLLLASSGNWMKMVHTESHRYTHIHK